ncbi:MAG: hypothetical protein ACFFG0_35660, partial [Candidatus Thorarchaeota archaeon]
ISRGLSGVTINLNINSIGSAIVDIALPSMKSTNKPTIGYDDNILLKRKKIIKKTFKEKTTTYKTFVFPRSTYVQLEPATPSDPSISIVDDIVSNYSHIFKYTNSEQDKNKLISNINSLNSDISFIRNFKIKIEVNNEYVYEPIYIIDSKDESNKANLFDETINYYPILDESQTQCFFKPMDKVIIYMTPRFRENYGNPKYLRVFVGILDSSTVNYSNGALNVKLLARDLMKWLQISYFNINPALDNTTFESYAETFGITPLQSNLAGKTCKEIITAMIVGLDKGELELNEYDYKIYWENGDYREKLIRKRYNSNGDTYEVINSDPNSNDFLKASPLAATEKIRYYMQSVPIKGCGFIPLSTTNEIQEKDSEIKKTKKDTEQRIPFNAEQLKYDPNLADYPPIVKMLRSNFSLWEHDYQSRYEICQSIAELLECELFMDCDGSIMFKPPYYNYNPGILYKIDDDENFRIINGDQYLILNKDIISYNFSEDDTNLITVFWVKGLVEYLGDTGIMKMNTSYKLDEKLAKQFGLKIQKKTVPFMGTEKDKEQRDLFASAFMNRRNSEYRKGNMTIKLRPELHLGRTIAILGEYEKKINTNNYNPTDSQDISYCLNIEAQNDIIQKKPTQATVRSNSNPNASLLSSIMVYYISGITHIWKPGQLSTTNLQLTHGRYWQNYFGILNFTKEETGKIFFVDYPNSYIDNAKSYFSTYKKEAKNYELKLDRECSEVTNLFNDEQLDNKSTNNGKIHQNSTKSQTEKTRLSNLIKKRDTYSKQIKINEAKAVIVELYVKEYINNDKVITDTFTASIKTDYSEAMTQCGVSNFNDLVDEVNGILSRYE